MNTLNSLTAMLSDSRLLVVFDLWLKAAILFATAGITVAVLSHFRASAATRHFVWLLAIVGSLIIVPLSSILPAWTIELTANSGAAPSTADLTTTPLIVAELRASEIDSQVSAQAPTHSPTEETSSIREPAAVVSRAGTPDTPAHGTDWPTVVLSILAVGAFVSLLPICLGALSLRRLSRACKNVTDDRLLSLLNELRQQLSIRRRVALVTCSKCINPNDLGPCESSHLTAGRLSKLECGATSRGPAARTRSRPALRLPDSDRRPNRSRPVLDQSVRLVGRARVAARTGAGLRRPSASIGTAAHRLRRSFAGGRLPKISPVRSQCRLGDGPHVANRTPPGVDP